MMRHVYLKKPRSVTGAFFLPFVLLALTAAMVAMPHAALAQQQGSVQQGPAQQGSAPSSAPSIITPELSANIGGYLSAMLKDAVAQLGDKTVAKAERDRRVIAFLYKYGDMPSVAQSLTGRYWARASAEQQTGYMKAFEDYVLWSFAEGLEDLEDNQSLRVDDILAAGDQFFVRTSIIEASGSATPVDWKLRRDGATWRITDVMLEGVSPLKMMQDDFTAVLRASAGSFDQLNAVLRKKAAEPKKTN